MLEEKNFIPANELPVAEGDEVSVLCLENGEMKQKPASGLGGGEKWDAVFEVTNNDWGNPDNYTLVSGSYAEIKAKMLNGDEPKFKVVQTGEDEDGNTWYSFLNVTTMEICDADNSVMYFCVQYGTESMWLCLTPDNVIITAD